MSVSEQARKQANLRLLQRTCLREINDIVQTATHVVLYEFICDAWQKSNIEGSLFLTQTPNKYQLVILNRHSTENLQMDVTGSMQLQHQDPYLIFRERIGDATRIRGIWFHNADERVAMTTALQLAIERLQAGNLPPLPTTASPLPPPRPSSQQRKASPAAPLLSSSVDASPPTSAAALAPLLASMAVSTDATSTTSTSQFSTTSSSSPVSPSGGGVALDKKSLQLALLSLIQDDRFLDLIHSQYLRVVHARVKKQQQQQHQPNNGDK